MIILLLNKMILVEAQKHLLQYSKIKFVNYEKNNLHYTSINLDVVVQKLIQNYSNIWIYVGCSDCEISSITWQYALFKKF